MNQVADVLGRVGLPAPVAELARERWDVIVVGGAHNGHIFQGEVRPGQMWERRLTPRTPIEGVYLCGAATHPGGSVIAANGKNAAETVLADRDE